MEEKIVPQQNETGNTEGANPATQPQAPANAPREENRTRRAETRRRSNRTGTKERSEFDKKVLSARRVTRVVSGGRRMSLAVAVVVGDRRGRVGIGTGKGADMAIATDKAVNSARKNMITLSLTKNHGIAHDVKAKYAASQVHLRPGQGFVAGGAVRIVADLAGIRNINAKILSRSKNHLNNAQATMKALQKLIK